MRIAFLTGIWPPDVGGPATHGPDFSRFLVGRGHTVRVVTMGDGEPTERPCEIDVVSRKLPFPLRYGLIALKGPGAARSADVLYASATLGAAAAAATLARRPFVAKLVSDPAYERARRYGLFSGTTADFQRCLDAPVRGAQGRSQRVVAARPHDRGPERVSRADRGAAGGWIRTACMCSPTRRRRRGTCEPEQLEPGTFVFVGRLTAAKDLPTAIAALELVPAARLVIVGDGPDRAELERAPLHRRPPGGSSFAGRCSATRRSQVVAGAEAGLLSSAWENLPHSPSKRSRSACRWFRPPSAVCPRSSGTARTGCSCRPAGPTSWPPRCAACSRSQGCASGSRRSAKPSVEAISSEAIYGRLEDAARGGGSR